MLVGQRGEVLAARSFKLGAVRLTNRFFAGERLHPSAVSSCRTYVRSTLSPFGREVAAHGFEVAVGSSGTIQAVAAMAQAATGAEPPRSFNRFRAHAPTSVRAVVKRLVGAPSVKQRGQLPGARRRPRRHHPRRRPHPRGRVRDLRRRRADGVATTPCARACCSTPSSAPQGGSLHHLRDVSRRSVLHLAELCDEEPEHSAHVARLALELFDGSRPSPSSTGSTDLGEPAREYLEAGALLANVGLFISHSQHHLHSYYVIRNTERADRASPTTRSRSSP